MTDTCTDCGGLDLSKVWQTRCCPITPAMAFCADLDHICAKPVWRQWWSCPLESTDVCAELLERSCGTGLHVCHVRQTSAVSWVVGLYPNMFSVRGEESSLFWLMFNRVIMKRDTKSTECSLDLLLIQYIYCHGCNKTYYHNLGCVSTTQTFMQHPVTCQNKSRASSWELVSTRILGTNESCNGPCFVV